MKNLIDRLRSGFSKLGLATRFIMISSVSLMVTLGALTYLVSNKTTQTMDERSVVELNGKAEIVLQMMTTYDTNLREAAGRLGSMFSTFFPGTFSLDPTKTVDIAGTATPVLKNGGTTLNLNFDPAEKFTSVTGAVATVFVRRGDDFLRITTTLRKENGDRAVGTFLGKQHPAYTSMIKGETWTGKARLFGKDYMTQYRPIRAQDGTVIGLLFVGLDFTAGLKTLKDSIKRIRIVDTGYIYAVDASPGPNYGFMVLHPSREGEDLLASQNSSAVIKELLEKRNGIMRYSYADKGETAEREKVVVYREFKNWGWVIAGEVYAEEFAREAIALRHYLMMGMFASGALLAVMLYFGMRRMVLDPLQRAGEIADAIANGRLDNEIHSRTRDEAGWLLHSMKTM